MPPEISVIMPVHNGERFLREAVDSILGQTFRDLELIVVDDGSGDRTPVILDSFDDRRIRRLTNDHNIGLTRSLNRGLENARGDFVARMDADDVAEPHRLERQQAFMAADPEVGLCGTAAGRIDEAGNGTGIVKMPLNDIEIRWWCLTGNPFLHPTVMIRRPVLAETDLRYDESFETAQDYDLWARMLEKTRGANLAEPLVRLRVHDRSVSRIRDARQADDHIRTALLAMEKVWPGHPLTEAMFPLLRRLVTEPGSLEGYADTHRIRLLGIYAELLNRFADKHLGASGLGALYRRERVLIVYSALKRPWRRGLTGLMAKLLAADPLLPVYGAMRALGGVLCRRRFDDR